MNSPTHRATNEMFFQLVALLLSVIIIGTLFTLQWCAPMPTAPFATMPRWPQQVKNMWCRGHSLLWLKI